MKPCKDRINMRHAVLSLAKLILTSRCLLLVMAVVILGVSFYLSVYSGQWHWYQRSGSLVVSIGAILSTRRLLRLGMSGIIERRSYFEIEREAETGSANRSDEETTRDLVAAYWGFWIVGIGTIVWAYGDLVGCLIAGNMSCIR